MSALRTIAERIGPRVLPAGLWRVAIDLRFELRVQYRHRRSLIRARRFSTQTGLKLHLGCGDNVKPGWVNVDVFAKEADLHLDLRETFPFRDGSVSIIYSEHFFEHLEYPGEVRGFLSESLRVLEPGGRLSLGVPDTEWAINAYVTSDQEWLRLAREVWHPAWCNTRLHSLNYHFRQGREHKYAYDFETLARVLEEAGFVSIVQRSFDPGLDSPVREIGTLYVEAHKPRGEVAKEALGASSAVGEARH